MKMNEKNSEYLYIATTTDKYELPIAVADSTKELADMLGIAHKTVSMMMSPINQKNRPHSGFYKVYVGDIS